MRLDRLSAMEQYVLERGTASLEELAEKFDVSTHTVRRDLIDLLRRGNMQKVYGGVSATGNNAPVPLSVRSTKNTKAKEVIGKLASSLVKDNMSVFLDSGSTTACLLPYLTERNNVTVITHSLTALYEASKYRNLRVIALGGMYNPATSSFVGGTTLEALSRMSIDLVFIAATGVSLENGLTNTTYFEVEIKRFITQQNKRVVLMADHSKFDRAALLTYCDFDKLSAVVTDVLPSERYLEVMQQNNIRLLCPREKEARD